MDSYTSTSFGAIRCYALYQQQEQAEQEAAERKRQEALERERKKVQEALAMFRAAVLEAVNNMTKDTIEVDILDILLYPVNKHLVKTTLDHLLVALVNEASYPYTQWKGIKGRSVSPDSSVYQITFVRAPAENGKGA
jgi:hypothetical protein